MKKGNLFKKKIRLSKLFVFDDYLKKELKNPAFREGYEKARKKVSLGYQIFLARKKANLTQSALADLIGTRQSNISRLEFGDYNFTVEMLQKIAKALHFDIEIKFRPQLKKAA